MTPRLRYLLIDQLVAHEGLKLRPYADTVGTLTIGIGRNLTDVGISRGEAFDLADHDIDAAVADLLTFSWFADVDPVRQRALIDVRFNLGPTRFRTFKRMLAALAQRDYLRAAVELADSKWRMDVGDRRAVRLIVMLRTGDPGPAFPPARR